MNAPTPLVERSSTKEDVKNFYQLKTTRTVELWMQRGWIPYQKIGKLVRFNLDEVQRALAERCGRNRVV